MKNFLVKSGIAGMIVLGLLIPVQMVKSLVEERKERRDELVQNMGSVWGRPKIIYGLFIHDGKNFHAPKEFEVDGSIETEVRKKGIFELPFYTADLDIRARFSRRALYGKNTKLIVAISDIGSIDIKSIRQGERAVPVWYGEIPKNTGLMSVALNLPGNGREIPNGSRMAMKLRIQGMDLLHFSPVAKKTLISMTSNWNDPSFTGDFLPTKRKIAGDGFTAEWDLALSDFIETSGTLSYAAATAFGVNLFMPVDIYTKTDRCLKYAILFIVLTFLTFFIFETMNPLRIHPMQYLLVGFALVLFYMLLLSLSEHLHFAISYGSAALATVGLITFYSATFLGERLRAWLMGGILTALYGFLYILLHLEDYALLFGATGLFVILALVMFITRNLDWYNLKLASGEEREPRENI